MPASLLESQLALMEVDPAAYRYGMILHDSSFALAAPLHGLTLELPSDLFLLWWGSSMMCNM